MKTDCLRRGRIALVLLVVMLALAAPQASLGAPGSGNGVSGGAGHPKRNGHDPCQKTQGALPPFCQQAPEAPAGLLYPAVALVSISLVWSLERRRRRTRSAA